MLAHRFRRALKNATFLQVSKLCSAALATAIFLGGVAEAASPPAVRPTARSTATNVKVVRRFLEDVVNRGRLDLIDQFWTPDMTWRGASLGEIHGIEAYKAFMAANVGGAFVDMHLEIEEIIPAGDEVIVRFSNSGRNVGSFMGLPPTNNQARWEGIGIYKLHSGKISEAWFVEDTLGMFRQLGISKVP